MNIQNSWIMIVVVLLVCTHWHLSAAVASTEDKAFGQGKYDFYEHTLAVRDSLDPTVLKELRSEQILDIETSGNADKQMFDQRHTFPVLKSVFLDSANNAAHLKALAENYPNLRCIALTQGRDAAIVDWSDLKKFKKINDLQVKGCISNWEEFAGLLPNSLKSLVLSKTGVPKDAEVPFPSLPYLAELRLYYETVSPKLFSSLRGQKIKDLYLSYDKLLPGSLKALTQIESLKTLTLYRNEFDKTELEQLRQIMPSLSIRSL